METYFYPLTGAITALTLCLLARFFIKKKIDTLDLTEEVDEILQALLQKVTKQIPMASALLGGPMEEKLKDLGKEEFKIKEPKIKENLTCRFTNNFLSITLIAMGIGVGIGFLVWLATR